MGKEIITKYCKEQEAWMSKRNNRDDMDKDMKLTRLLGMNWSDG